jgi:ribose transport system substrate-binding protein
MTRRGKRPAFLMLACACLGLVLALAITACGGGSSSSSSSGGGSTEGGSSGNSEAATAKSELAKLYKGTFKTPESSGPAPKSGQNVWAILPGFAAVGSKLDAEAFKEGAEELGWNVTLKDGKFEPSVWLSSIREAIRANADAIWLEGIDCESVKAGLEEAKKAGILVIASAASDCEPALFSTETNFVDGGYTEYLEAVGEAQAIWAIANTNAEAKVLLVYENDLAGLIALNNGAKSRLEKCSTCEIVGEVPFTGTELGPPLQQKVEQALLQYPETTVVDGNYDSAVELGVAPAVRASGKEIQVLGYEGNPNNIELVRNGEQAMGGGYPFGWLSYAALGAIIRLQAGERSPGNSGMGIQVFDAENNLPPKGEPYVPPIEFRKYYREAWGL